MVLTTLQCCVHITFFEFEVRISGEYHLSHPPNSLVLTLKTRIEVLLSYETVRSAYHSTCSLAINLKILVVYIIFLSINSISSHARI